MNDCISRQAAIDFLKKPLSICCMMEYLENAPSVKPQTEPCEDTISRMQAKSFAAGSGLIKRIDGEDWINVSEVRENLDMLPSVQPAQKVGKWKRVSIDKYVLHASAFYRCSECGRDHIGMTNFCSNCGAKMEEGE